MISRILHHLTRNRPVRTIHVNGLPYLRRYHICKLLGYRIWLHEFLRCDAEPHVHDHPWSATSIILTGAYRELIMSPQRNFDVRDYTAPAINRIPAHKRHKILAVNPGTWSLMIVGKRHDNGWFFYDYAGDRTRGESPSNPDWHLKAGRRDD